jgi:hypothetical protein
MLREWLSKLAGPIAKKPPSTCGFVRSEIRRPARPLGEPVVSDPPGLFSMYIEDEAMALIESEGRLKRDEIGVLPARVYAMAKASGLVREDPMHLVVTTGAGRQPTESAMTVTRARRPLKADNGDEVAHSIMIFPEPFRDDMGQLENARSARLARPLDKQERQSFSQIRGIRCATCISHELVHLFVTDEFMSRFKGWELHRLELLTDALTVAVMRPIVERCNDDLAKFGLINGASYLKNELDRTWPDGVSPEDALRAMETMANKIIEAERAVLLGHDERPAARDDRAEA